MEVLHVVVVHRVEAVVVVEIKTIHDIPVLGVGIGFRGEIQDDIFNAVDELDFLELIPEHFLSLSDTNKLSSLRDKFTLVPHGVDLSIGSTNAVDENYMKALKNHVEFVDAPYWSEHLAFTKSEIHNIGHLSPVIRTKESLSLFVEKIQSIQERINRPLIIENVTYQVDFLIHEFTEPEFFNALYEQTGVGMLLDLTNLFINSKNHGFDPFEYLDALNPEMIVQGHLIGYELRDGYYVDSHGSSVQEDLWDFCDKVSAQVNFKSLVIEWDKNFPDDFNEVLNVVKRARMLFF